MIISRPDSLKKRAYESIRTAILQNELSRDQIYSEQWFADQFQISRTPVREALLQLRTEGFIEALPNRGVIIKPLTPEDARIIYQTRAAIEGFCSAYLAKHAKEPSGLETLARIETVLERCHQEFNHADEIQFHLEIINYVKNPEFIDQFNRMRAKIDIFWDDIAGQENRQEEIYVEHKKILDCMKAGDAQGAYNASKQHMDIVCDKIVHGGLFNIDFPTGRMEADNR